jgi:MFS family permease
MIVLDSSIMNIAIPSAKIDLGISDANQQWVITAYTLAFGSLLLLGGRIGDYMGRKKIFLVGLAGFAAASALVESLQLKGYFMHHVPFKAFLLRSLLRQL